MKKEYGAYLREKREEKNLSREQVSENTRMTVEVIEALENMHRKKFPSEVHHVGFIRLYANYLGLDSDEIVAIMKSNLVSEQPVDFTMIALSEEKKKRKKKAIVVMAVIGGVVLLAGLGFGLYRAAPHIVAFFETLRREKTDETRRRVEGINEILFFVNDTFVLAKDREQVIVTVRSVAPPIIEVGEKQYELRENKPHIVSLPKGKQYALTLREIVFERNGMLLRFDPQVAAIEAAQKGDEGYGEEDEGLLPQNVGEAINILSAFTRMEITVEIIVKEGATLYRYDTETRSERGRTDSRVVVEAQKFVDVYLPRASAVEVKINGKDARLPSNSLPFVFRAKWTRVGERYFLQQIALP